MHWEDTEATWPFFHRGITISL